MERTLRAALGRDHVHRVVSPSNAPLPQLIWTRSGSDSTTTLYDGEAHVPVVLLTVYDETFEGADDFLTRALDALAGEGSYAEGEGDDQLDPPLDLTYRHLAEAPDDPVDDYAEETQEYAVQTSIMLRTD